MAGTNLWAGHEEQTTAILRVSIDGENVYIPDTIGNLVTTPYSEDSRVGKLKRESDPRDPTLEKKGSPFWKHFEQEIACRAKKLPKADGVKPVAIMVHGFMADPRDPIQPDKPQRSDNPHDFSFHFNSSEQKHWRHTASWPLGLGFSEGDSGASGLAVAFGWNSQPDIFTSTTKLTTTIAFKVAPRLGREKAAKLGKAVAEAAKIVAKFGTNLGATGGQGLYDQLNEVLKGVEPELREIAKDRNIPTYNEVYLRAPAVAPMLVDVIRVLAHTLPSEQPIDLFCHSLGSRVVIEAIQAIAARGAQDTPEAEGFRKLLKRVGRVIFIGGAEYSANARQMLKTAHAAKGETAFYNFTSAKDRVLDIFAERIFARDDETQPVIGLRGLQPEGAELNRVPREWIRSHWLDVELDNESSAKKWLLEKRQMKVAGAHEFGLLNHWYYFTSKDNLKLYAAILREREKWAIAKINEEIAAFAKSTTKSEMPK